ncbi:MAG TPA: GyrI-like domain-containing protein [Methanoregula sp.]|nr:GyrI-like domain-containing protein [Methanoregula sp.]
MDDLAYSVKKIPGKIVMGVQRRTSNADGRSVKDIPACWQDFFSLNMASKIPDRARTPAMFAVYSDYERDWTGEYSYLIGSEVTRADRIPDGLAVVRIPAQTYAVFTAAGHMPDAVLGVWASVWGTKLPRAYTFDFELYDARLTRPDKKEAEVYIAIDDAQLQGMQIICSCAPV